MMDVYTSVQSFTDLDGKISAISTCLVLETSLEIVINDSTHILIMFTPHMARELITGFMFTEGLIDHISDIKDIEVSLHKKHDLQMSVKARVTISSQRFSRSDIRERMVSYSSSGLYAKDNMNYLKGILSPVQSDCAFSMNVLKKLPDSLEKNQPIYKKTGGAHAAALFDSKGTPICFSEDMGRHNALDKVIGHILMNELPCEDKILVSSGRASLEMMLKTARASIPVFVAMSRVTSRAVEAAKQYHITLIDLAKGTNRIYSHVQRIKEFKA